VFPLILLYSRGKSTLLRLLAKRQLPVPENLDVLLVEQEVVGSEATALEAVVAADVELMGLRAEEKELTYRLEHPEEFKDSEVRGVRGGGKRG
jgi:ATP-binding cassette subfamily F protein 1